MKSKILKVIALANFIILMSAFIFYRCGYFDFNLHKSETILNSPNGGTETKIKKDSVKTNQETKKQWLYSSKSIIIIDADKKKQDSLKKKVENEKIFLPSSKVAIMPRTYFPKNDSIKKSITPQDKKPK